MNLPLTFDPLFDVDAEVDAWKVDRVLDAYLEAQEQGKTSNGDWYDSTLETDDLPF
jgi:hypothetical protein